MIDVSHDLPNPDLSDPDFDGRDRAPSSGSTAAERDRTDGRSAGWEALVALARLLGRQAGQEHMQTNGACDDL